MANGIWTNGLRFGAKALGNIALTSGVHLLGDVLAGKSVKQAAKAHALEGANTAKMQAIQRRRGMLKPGEDVLEAPDVRPERGKHQEPNAELKRERHLHLRPDVNRPSKQEPPRDIFG